DAACLGGGRRLAETCRCLGIAIAQGCAVLAGGAGSAALQLRLSFQPGGRSGLHQRSDPGVLRGERKKPVAAKGREPEIARRRMSKLSRHVEGSGRTRHPAVDALRKCATLCDPGVWRETLRLNPQKAAAGLEQIVGARHGRRCERQNACWRPAAFETFLALEKASWKGARGTALLSDSQDAAFVRRLFQSLAARQN